MTETTTRADVLATLLGIEPGSPLAQLRARRSEATTHTQGSYDALFVAPSATRVTPAERFATALRVAALHAEPALIDHYAAQLRAAPGGAELVEPATAGPDAAGLPERLRAMLRHADLLVIRPAAATRADLAALQRAGLAAPEVVTVSQVIAFTSFEVRVFVASRCCAATSGEHRPSSSVRATRRPRGSRRSNSAGRRGSGSRRSRS